MEIDAERNLDNLATMYGFLLALSCFHLFLGCSAEDAVLPLGPSLLLYQILGGHWKVHG